MPTAGIEGPGRTQTGLGNQRVLGLDTGHLAPDVDGPIQGQVPDLRSFQVEIAQDQPRLSRRKPPEVAPDHLDQVGLGRGSTILELRGGGAQAASAQQGLQAVFNGSWNPPGHLQGPGIGSLGTAGLTAPCAQIRQQDPSADLPGIGRGRGQPVFQRSPGFAGAPQLIQALGHAIVDLRGARPLRLASQIGTEGFQGLCGLLVPESLLGDRKPLGRRLREGRKPEPAQEQEQDGQDVET
jgi:hypothetical protein